ncbi:MAG: nuclear transport factor 2 family protein [Rhodospirillaceae bacterium]|nr:nuclear transport factor 2 family protein [Rhodospirillaceae bacterium]
MTFSHHRSIAAVVAAAAIVVAATGLWRSGGAAPRAVAAEMSAVDRLVAQNEITQQITLYTLLVDGDGVNKPDPRAWADRLFTDNAVFEIYGASGKMRSRQSGREEIYQNLLKNPALPPGVFGRHFNVATYFDELTPTTAKVRTVTTMVTGTRSQPTGCEKLGDEACGGRAIRVTGFVYHDTFTRTPDGWKKSFSVIRSDL